MGPKFAPRVYLLVLSLLLTGISFTLGREPVKPYTVVFAELSDECREGDINIDSRTGASLRCWDNDFKRDPPDLFTTRKGSR